MCTKSGSLAQINYIKFLFYLFCFYIALVIDCGFQEVVSVLGTSR